MPTSHRDYVPQNAAQFQVFLSGILNYVQNKQDSAPPQWVNIPEERYNTLSQLNTKFVNAYKMALATPTPANILARNQAQVQATHELRGFVNQFLRFTPVTDVDRVAMGIPNHDTIRTDHKVVTEIVDYVLHLRNIREIMVDFWIKGETHKAKPHGYDGAVIVWGILDHLPQHTDDLIHHTMASRTPYPIHFDEPERGKTVYFACSWQNERGIIGQWSEFKSAIIP